MAAPTPRTMFHLAKTLGITIEELAGPSDAEYVEWVSGLPLIDQIKAMAPRLSEKSQKVVLDLMEHLLSMPQIPGPTTAPDETPPQA
jgi:hypothetical protein